MENNEELISKKTVEEYIENASKNVKTIKQVIKEEFISEFLPQYINYKTKEDLEEKKQQIMQIINYYDKYMKYLKQINKVKFPEFLAIVFDYDIIKSNKIENKDELIEEYIKNFKLDYVPEFSEKIKYYCQYYFEYTKKSIDNYENISDILNKILSKKFAFNIYAKIVNNEKIHIYDKIRKLSAASEFLIKKYNIVSYTDMFENIVDIISKYYKEKDLNFSIENDEELEKTELMIKDFYEKIQFPQFFETIGDTPETIIFQALLKLQDTNSNDYIIKVLEIFDKFGNKIGMYRTSNFYNELYKNMELSFDKLVLNNQDEQIKKTISQFSKTKYSGKMDFSLTRKIIPRWRKKMIINKENTILKSLEDKMAMQLIELAKKDYEGTIKFIDTIPEFICGESKYTTNMKIREEILPQILGKKLSTDERVIIEGKKDYDEIIRFLKTRKKVSNKQNDNIIEKSNIDAIVAEQIEEK